ncbi:MAG: hypothetical protein ACM3ML_37345 [Micromonosporaceae bacterium]
MGPPRLVTFGLARRRGAQRLVYTDVTFRAADGVRLSGWYGDSDIRGAAGR